MQRHVFAAIVTGTLFVLMLLNLGTRTAQSAEPAYPPAQPSPRPTIQQTPTNPVGQPGSGGAADGFADPSLKESVEPKQARVGDVVEFNLSIINWGSGYAENVVVTDNLPEALDLLDVKASRGLVKMSGRTATIDIGSMGANEVIVVRMQARVSERAQSMLLTKTASVVCSNDKVPSNNQSSIQLEVVSAADVAPLELPVTGQSDGRVLYSVQPGDTLTQLAARHSTTVEALKAANGLKGDTVSVNQILLIPSSTPRASVVAAVNRATYTVRDNENLFRIGLRFGVSWETIARANHIVNPLRLQTGQSLVIPAGYWTPTGRTYVVKAGDTLTGITLKHNTSVSALKLSNNLRGSLIVPGQVLRIP